MNINKTPKRRRFPVSIISHVVWLYHRFNNSYRDIQEQKAVIRFLTRLLENYPAPRVIVIDQLKSYKDHP